MKRFKKNFASLFVPLALSVAITNTLHASHYTPDPYWEGTLGPLTIRSLAPVQSLRLAPIPRSPYGLPAKQTEIQLNLATASIYIKERDRYFMDFHFVDKRLAVNHGFANNWSAEVSFNERTILNAHLDQMTVNFHNIFGLDQNGRTDLPKNDTHIVIGKYDVDLGKEIRGDFSQTLGISIQKVLIDKRVNWPALAMNLNISYELLNNGFTDRGNIDYGLQVSAAQKYNRGYSYGNISYSHFDSDTALGIPLTDSQFSGMLGYEHKVTENQSLLLQYLFTEGAIENLGSLSEFSHEVHLGYKWRTESNLWEVGVVENVINLDNGPDVAFTLGVTHRM